MGMTNRAGQLRGLLWRLAVIMILTLLPTTRDTIRAQFEDVLPRPLYYLGDDQQIHRLEVDAEATSIITAEPMPITHFDVSPVDGALAYVTANQLIVTDNIGQGRLALFDGGALALEQGYVKVNDMLTREVTAPRWSPDGSQIAFGYGGVNLIPKAGGVAILTLANTTGDASASPDMPIGAKIYRPHAWSPDGTRLMATFNYVPEGGGYAIFPAAGGAAVEPKDAETGFIISCCEASWTADSSSVYVSSPAQGMVQAGLWLVNANTGEATTLIRGWQEGGDSNVKLVGMAHSLSDGKLYYFYGLGILDMGTAPLNMFRADGDGVSGQTMLRADAYEISEALWSPDGSGAVIADQSRFDYGNKLPPFYYPLRWLRADGGDVVTLPEVGQALRWGVQ